MTLGELLLLVDDLPNRCWKESKTSGDMWDHLGHLLCGTFAEARCIVLDSGIDPCRLLLETRRQAEIADSQGKD